jgi:chromosome partitioning protein
MPLAAFQAHPLGVLAIMKDLKEVTESWRLKTTVLAHAPDSESAQRFRALVPKIDPSLPDLTAVTTA